MVGDQRVANSRAERRNCPRVPGTERSCERKRSGRGVDDREPPSPQAQAIVGVGQILAKGFVKATHFDETGLGGDHALGRDRGHDPGAGWTWGPVATSPW